MRAVVVIPTVRPERAHACGAQWAGTTGLVVLTISNLLGDDVSGWFSDRVFKVGFEDSCALAEAFARLAGVPERDLFGDPRVGRSFGGAGNLALAAGVATGADALVKLDDDCFPTANASEWRDRGLGWLATADIVGGRYRGVATEGVRALAPSIARQLGECFYEPRQLDEVLSDVRRGATFKAGHLFIRSSAARLVCFPVLYSDAAGTHLRGEVYDFVSAARSANLRVEFDADLSVEHRPDAPRNLQAWLESSIASADLGFVRRLLRIEFREPSRAERLAARHRLASALSTVDLPCGIDSTRLWAIFRSVDIEETDLLLERYARRNAAWRALCAHDLAPVLEAACPALVRGPR
jgi:hypothetical protein